ncbi:MAG: SusC/RagA family TonB-linked outer membrane protein, partial [Cyclobacteriaceae bacterium]
VKTSKNSPGMSDVRVAVKGTDVSATTDFIGNYEILLPAGGKILVFTFDGYTSQEIVVTADDVIDVIMIRNENTDSKEERVKLGFGSVSKSASTNSVSSISGDELTQQPVVSLEQTNQGKASGVLVQGGSGELGSASSILIRGGSSLTGSNEPLYVVDGIPLTSGSQSNIDPNNIESIDVLKDAASTSIYGARAANGVVLITTKSGSAGETKINIDYQFGVGITPKKLDLYSADDHLTQLFEIGIKNLLDNIVFRIGWVNEGGDLAVLDDISNSFSDENIRRWIEQEAITTDGGITINFSDDNLLGDALRVFDRSKDQLIYETDWQDEIFRAAIMNRVNASISGGNEKTGYFGSVSYLDQEGILIGNDFDRLNLQFNVNHRLSDKLTADLSLSGARTSNNRLADDADLGNPLKALLLPASDEGNPNDNFNLRTLTGRNFYNPVTEVTFSDYIETSNFFIGNLGLTYTLSEKLSLNLDGGVDLLDETLERRQGPETLDGNPTGLSRLLETTVSNYLINGYIDYNTDLGSKNKLTAILGTSYQKSETTITERSARVNSIADLETLREDSPSLLNNPIPGSASSFLSVYTRFNFSFNDKYFLQASGRLDGSSRFSPDNRYGFFPAISAGWDLAQESFLENAGAVNLLKLKTSYGLIGNTPSADFLYRANLFLIRYGDEQGLRFDNIANEGLKWESTGQFDIGLDYALFGSRLSGAIGYYIKNTSDLLFPRPLTQTSGFTSVIDNIATMENKGWEFSLSSQNVITADFRWTTDFNITANENTIRDLSNQRLITGVNAYLEGEAAGVFFMPVYAGVDPQTGSALYDIGDGATTTDYNEALDNRQVVGNPNPDLFGGLSNTLTYKNFTLQFAFQFVIGVDIYFQTGEELSNSGFLGFSQTKDQLNRWYAPGDEAPFPGVNPAADIPNSSSRWLQDGSYLRLNNLTLTYNFPERVTDNLNLDKFSFFIGGQNLFTITDYSGYDPDVNSVDPLAGSFGANILRGIDNFTAPQARMFITGIKIGF